jgi:hypothetical protein
MPLVRARGRFADMTAAIAAAGVKTVGAEDVEVEVERRPVLA